MFDQNGKSLRPPPLAPSSSGHRSGQVDNSIDWRFWLRAFWILIIAPINIFIGLALTGYDLKFLDNKLMAIQKIKECREMYLPKGPYVDDEGLSVEIPSAGTYEVCKEGFLWRAE